VMCPSFRVTGNEADVTRGRANSLRLAISGQLGPDALTSEAMLETMKLCVSCKGCRRECPTGVDMAKMKIEVLAASNKRRGLSLHDRLVAYLPRYAPYAARLAPLMNARNVVPGIAWLTERLTGMSANRALPRWRRDFFRADRTAVAPLPLRGEGSGVGGNSVGGGWGLLPPLTPRRKGEGNLSATGAEQAVAANPLPAEEWGEGTREVALFADTFNTYFEPENLHAALEVLTRLGYRVALLHLDDGGGPSAEGESGRKPRPLCCGRTFLSAGLVDEARAEAQRVLAAAAPFLARGIPIVGLEPSCLLTLRDEFLSMLPGAEAEGLASHAFLFEEFLVREAAAGRIARPIGRHDGKVLLHGHCHQKAFGVMGSVDAALALVEGLEVETVESSCCGMAGAFGYGAETYAVSMAMGELTLLPAVRRAAPDAVIAADGFSCRHQIRDGTGRQPRHVARILHEAMSGATTK
jgi:Fe-S oxidoreductase